MNTLIGQLTTDKAGEALSALCAQAKTRQGKAEINAALSDRSVLQALCASPVAKVRKNAYRLIGALERKADAPLLLSALETETTLFCVPSLLLALGALGQEDAVRSYAPPALTGGDTDKQAQEIARAHRLALASFAKDDAPRVTVLPAEETLVCRAPAGFQKQLADELTALGFVPQRTGAEVSVTTAKIGKLYRARCLVEALLPRGTGIPLDAGALATAAGACPGQRYRVELRGDGLDRATLIEGLVARIGQENNPSHYDCELRIEAKNGTASVYWKLWNVPDDRYPWRTETVAASMHPATAACLARAALSRVNAEQPRVLDPFCGSGTLLFSIEKERACTALIGVDRSPDAIQKARKNARAGHSRTMFIQKDCRKLRAGEGFDLVLSNLPFGNRVGTHEENEQTYRAFVRLLPELLCDGGTAVLYTMEYTLLKKLLENEPRLRLSSTARTEAGGLTPQVFFVDKAGKN